MVLSWMKRFSQYPSVQAGNLGNRTMNKEVLPVPLSQARLGPGNHEWKGSPSTPQSKLGTLATEP